MKNILVTVGKGFLGSYVVNELKKRKHKVELFNGDITNKQDLSNIKYFDIVYHIKE